MTEPIMNAEDLEIIRLRLEPFASAFCFALDPNRDIVLKMFLFLFIEAIAETSAKDGFVRLNEIQATVANLSEVDKSRLEDAIRKAEWGEVLRYGEMSRIDDILRRGFIISCRLHRFKEPRDSF